MNPDLELVLDRERKRYEFLLTLWRASVGHTNYRIDLYQHGESLGLTREECREIIPFLSAEDLINGDADGNGAITHKVIIEIEHSVKYPYQPTEHFHVQVIQHFHGSVGVIQNAPHSVANVEEAERDE